MNTSHPTDHLQSLHLKLDEEKAELEGAISCNATAKEIENRREFVAGI